MNEKMLEVAYIIATSMVETKDVVEATTTHPMLRRQFHPMDLLEIANEAINLRGNEAGDDIVVGSRVRFNHWIWGNEFRGVVTRMFLTSGSIPAVSVRTDSDGMYSVRLDTCHLI